MSLVAQTLTIGGEDEGEQGESRWVSVSKWIWSGGLRPDSIAGGIILHSSGLLVSDGVLQDPKIPNFPLQEHHRLLPRSGLSFPWRDQRISTSSLPLL